MGLEAKVEKVDKVFEAARSIHNSLPFIMNVGNEDAEFINMLKILIGTMDCEICKCIMLYRKNLTKILLASKRVSR